ncbi:hypothetical protein [Saccharospirillum impatiens]|uniref:hypothetical protein n=1 Tax=Saccharospirillum impatiens TaxID=169438 RepID=UPI00042563E9|nr:hypothetical protein [Saccharospirillum impatiens]
MKTLSRALVSLLLLTPMLAWSTNHREGITLVQGTEQQVMNLEELHGQANIAIDIYEPFRRDHISIRGIRLVDFVEQHFNDTPDSIALQAHDGYTVEITDWQDRNWILMTHENGRPLTLRTHGPLRLVEEDLRDRDPEILRDFTDWVWMIKQITATQ